MNDDLTKRRSDPAFRARATQERDPKETPVLILHDAPEVYLDKLRERYPEMPLASCNVAEELPAVLDKTRPKVVVSFVCKDLKAPVQRRLLECESVEWIHLGRAGVDHLLPWDPVKVTVTNSSGILAPFLAETVMGAILMLNGGLHRYIRQQIKHVWQNNLWRPLAGQTLLIIGLGNIGKRVAVKAKGMGMRVIGIRNRPQKPEEIDELFSMSQLKEALGKADFVALHMPYTKETYRMIDAAALKAMRPTAFLINAARGAVVDEAALAAALSEGEIAGAYLDVFEKEPLPEDSPLWDLENVVISPHCADVVTDWEERFARFFVDNLDRWLKGTVPANVVDPAQGY
ncbi:MAG TPA: D-2-hydroxyacid dehydrogenase [Kiloniellaceae bacterium]|nr:D-2-hydroxyacid dehydrogenase [Kiloniellaceae bacterium]